MGSQTGLQSVSQLRGIRLGKQRGMLMDRHLVLRSEVKRVDQLWGLQTDRKKKGNTKEGQLGMSMGRLAGVPLLVVLELVPC
jgi:hypothetical protein